MSEGETNSEKQDDAPSAAGSWAARRDEVRAAAAADQADALRAAQERRREMEEEARNPMALYLGLLGILFLVAAGWFVLENMRCDSFYANIARVRHSDCDKGIIVR